MVVYGVIIAITVNEISLRRNPILSIKSPVIVIVRLLIPTFTVIYKSII